MSVLSWHRGRSDVCDVIMATCCAMQLGIDSLEPEWPELLHEISCPMAEFPQTGSHQACGFLIVMAGNMWEGLSGGALPSEGDFACEIFRLHAAVIGQGG